MEFIQTSVQYAKHPLCYMVEHASQTAHLVLTLIQANALTVCHSVHFATASSAAMLATKGMYFTTENASLHVQKVPILYQVNANLAVQHAKHVMEEVCTIVFHV